LRRRLFSRGQGALEHDEDHAGQQDRDGQQQHCGNDGAHGLIVNHTPAHGRMVQARALNHTEDGALWLRINGPGGASRRRRLRTSVRA